ncbi:MAG: ferritin-like domain-containing protein [Myxococcota bacterium]
MSRTVRRPVAAPPVEEPHQLKPEAFFEEVHSFEFWFQAVEGYLRGRPYGHFPSSPDSSLDEPERESLITTFCNYCIGETTALEAASGMIAFAPNRHAKIFLATQVVDEARHLEVLLHRLAELGVADPEPEIERRGNRKLKTFKRRLLECVESRDWEAALFAQNVILEAMEFTVFEAHAERADPLTREVLEGIVKDERRHMGFGENELGRRLRSTPHIRARLSEVRKELDPLVIDVFEETLDAVGVPLDSRPDLGRRYLASVTRLGFTE